MATNFYDYILGYLNIPHSSSYVLNYARTQPYGNSYKALTVFLSKYNISSSGIKTDDKTSVDSSMCPFITIIQGEWSIVNCINQDSVKLSCLSSPHQEIEMPADVFFSFWDGTGLLIDDTKNAKEPNLNERNKQSQRVKFKNITLILAYLVVILFSLFNSPYRYNAFFYIVIAVNLFGLFISCLLLKKQLHIHSGIADKLCGFIKESQCENVTDSAGANLFGLVKLSEVGFGFFCVNLIVLLFVSRAVAMLALAAVLVLPFSFWSVWYQKFRARSWCALCLITLSVMWIQAGLYWAMGMYGNMHFSVFYGAIVAASYVLAVFLTNIAMQRLEKYRELKQVEKDFIYLKSQEKVVDAIIKGEEKYDIGEETCSSLVFGDKNAKRTITIFSNPYCGPCARMHERVQNMPGECVRVQYVMTAFSEDRTDINRYIIAHYKKYGPEETWKMLTEWYGGGKWQKAEFFKKYDLDIRNDDVENEFAKQKAWPQDKPFTGTPTVLVNGYELKWPYEVDDYMEVAL